MFAGACTGSSSGGGIQRPGRFPLNQHYYAGRHHCQTSTTTAPTGTVSSSLTAGQQSLAASASGDFGVARVYAEQHIRNWQVENLFFPTSRAFAGWVDVVTIDAPGLTGQQGVFTAALGLSGTLAAFGYQGIAAFRVNQFHGPSFGAETMLFDLVRRDAASVVNVDQTITTSVPFVYGTPFRYGIFVSAETTNGSEGGLNHLPGDAVSDFDSTVEWLGLTSVTAGGAVVMGYAVSTVSGIGWIAGPTAVVPEPRSVALLAGGLAALGGVGLGARRGHRAGGRG